MLLHYNDEHAGEENDYCNSKCKHMLCFISLFYFDHKGCRGNTSEISAVWASDLRSQRFIASRRTLPFVMGMTFMPSTSVRSSTVTQGNA